MAIPAMLGALYRTVASYGAKQARKASPRYLKAASKAYGKKIGEGGIVPAKVSAFTSKQFAKLPKEGKGVFTQEKINKLGQGIGKKYGKVYRGTLGTSNRRKVTTGVIGGGIGFDIFDDD